MGSAMYRHIDTSTRPGKVMGSVLLAALGKQLRRAYEEVLGEHLPLDIEKAFEHLSDFAAKADDASIQRREPTDIPQHIF
jgi:hypothetical protein